MSFDEENEIEKEEEKIPIVLQPADAILNDDQGQNLVSNYIEPDPNCVCCNLPGISIKINEAFLNGSSYAEIISKFSNDVEAKVGKKLDSRTISDHFTKHFNHKGVAVAEYNRRHGMKTLPVTEQEGMKGIFSTLVNKRVSELELLDLAMKEQIKRLKELEDMKEERIREKRTYNLDQLIMKQELIMNNLQTQVLTKLKLWQKSQFETKQIELLDRHLQFLDHKTASFLGLTRGATSLEPKLAKEAERLYLKVVIDNLVKRVKNTLDATPLDTYQKAQFFKELNRQFKGMEKNINDEFQEKLKNLKDVSEDNKDKDD